MTDIEKKLIEFARWVIELHRVDLAGFDGADIQDKLVELGLLQSVTVTEPCGEYCDCAEYYGEFPAPCLRLVEGVRL